MKQPALAASQNRRRHVAAMFDCLLHYPQTTHKRPQRAGAEPLPRC